MCPIHLHTHTQSGVRLKIKAWKPIKHTTTQNTLANSNRQRGRQQRQPQQQQQQQQHTFSLSSTWRRQIGFIRLLFFLVHFLSRVHTINPAYIYIERIFCVFLFISFPFLLSSSFPRALRFQCTASCVCGYGAL